MTPPPDRSSSSVKSHERTTIATAPEFNRQGRAWRPFRFERLEKISRTQVLLTERVRWLMPGVDAEGKVSDVLLARLKELFDDDVQLIVDYVHAIKPRELGRYVQDPTCLSVLVAAPHKTRGYLEIELGLAHAAIDRLLGGAGEAMALRALTEIEEGVISFVIIEALKALAPRIEPGLPRIRLEGMAHRVEEAMQSLAEERHVVVVQLKGVVGNQAGSLRFFLPEAVMALVNPPPRAPERRALVTRMAKLNLRRLKKMAPTHLRVEIGHLALEARQLQALGARDVVLLDELSVRSDRGASGPCEVRVGRGQVAYVAGEASVVNGRYQVELKEFIFGEDPQSGSPERVEGVASILGAGARTGAGANMAENAGEAGQERAQGAELLADVPLQIAVELARVSVSAEDVVSLRVGQVLDLGRLPNEPVELSVNNTIVARGELVEVEGQMGVRILSLA